ncbi:MAG: 5'-nucleotidase [Terriglobia bacterium]|nr:5'-nucleotidase [Terriglobia bacterium]
MLTIAVSSRALFHLEQEHALFESEGVESFNRYMRDMERIPLKPGPAFNLVRKLLALNTKQGPNGRDRVEVLLLSRNSPDAGMRILQSVLHYKLDIDRAAFCQGRESFRYADAFGAQLFLSLHEPDVEAAIKSGTAAARLLPVSACVCDEQEVRVAIDGDSVLFSDEADEIARTQGVAAFYRSELDKAQTPLEGGPFKKFFVELAALQKKFRPNRAPVRIALFTARSILAHERALRTLRSWGIALDEALFSCGRPKGPFLKAFGADIFFDDHIAHVESANANNVAAGHVPLGHRQPSVPVIANGD